MGNNKVSIITTPDTGSYDIDALYLGGKTPAEYADKTEGIFYVEGTGTAEGTWTGNNSRITSYYDGLIILYKINIKGAGTTTLNINNLGAKTVYRADTSKLTTHYGVNSVIAIAYMEDLNSGCWMVLNDYDSNTYSSMYCDTGASTAAKVASCYNYTATANTYAHILMRYANTKASALTLNVNKVGAKPIYINGTASSATNYTLPAGTYIIFYDGTNYYFQTDGTIPNHYTKTQIDTTLSSYVKGSGTVNYVPKFTAADTIGNGWQVKNITTKGDSQWDNVTNQAGLIPTMNTLSYWNGAWSGTSSNLTYSANGTIVGGSGLTANKIVLGNGNSTVKTSSIGITDEIDPDDAANVPTSQAIASYVGALTNQAVIFKGTLGTNGDITELKPAEESLVGDAYKVITAGTYQSISCNVGDLLICYTTDNTNYKWAHIPGDTNTDTLVKQSNTTTDQWRKVVLSAQSDKDAGQATSTKTNQVYVTPNVEVQASTGKLRAGGYVHTGVTSNADTTVLTADGGTKTISSILGSYVTTNTPQTISGVKTFSAQPIISTADGLKFTSGNCNLRIYNTGASPTDYAAIEVRSANTTKRNLFIDLDINSLIIGAANATADTTYKMKVDGTLGVTGVLTSTVANGTAPLAITSKTKVDNLNVDQVDGCDVETSLSDTSETTIPTSKAVADYIGSLGLVSDLSNYVTLTGTQTILGTKIFKDVPLTYESTKAAGTLVDMLVFKSTTRTGSPIKMIPYDVNGSGLLIGDGGLLMIGSGESPTSLYNKLKGTVYGGTETTYVASDGAIYFATNCQTIDSRKTATINTSGSVLAPGGFIHDGLTAATGKTKDDYVLLAGGGHRVASDFGPQAILQTVSAATYVVVNTGFTVAKTSGNFLSLELYSRSGEVIRVNISSNDSTYDAYALRLTRNSGYIKMKKIYFNATDGKIYVDTDQYGNGVGAKIIASSVDIVAPTIGTVTSVPSGATEITLKEVSTANTTYEADRGISLVSGKFGHSNTAITAVTTAGLYKIKYDAYGHITGTEAFTLPTVNNGTLTMSTSGTGISGGSTTFTANQSTAATFTVTLDSSAEGNRGANKVVVAKAGGQINSEKYTVTSGTTAKVTMQYDTSYKALKFVFN